MEGNDKENDQDKQALNKTFNIKDLGNLRYFLDLEIKRSEKDIMMNQRKYIRELLINAAILACKPTVTPICSLVKLSSSESVSFKMFKPIEGLLKIL